MWRAVFAGIVSCVFVVLAAQAGAAPNADGVSPEQPVSSRSISDITFILDAQKVENRDRMESLRKVAGENPPKGANPAALVRFYQSRGYAASAIGETEQALSDLREAVRLAAGMPDKSKC